MTKIDKSRFNGSIIVFGATVIIDIMTAIAVYYVLVFLCDFKIPVYLRQNEGEGFMAVVLAAIIGLTVYTPIIHRHHINVLDVFIRVFKTTLIQSLALMGLIRMITEQSQGVMRLTALYFAAYFITTICMRGIERELLKKIRRSGHNTRQVIFVGSDPVFISINQELNSSAAVGHIIKGYYGNHQIEGCPDELKYLGTRQELSKELEAGEIHADIIFYSMTANSDDKDVNELMNYCDKNIIQFLLVPRIYSNLNMDFTPISYCGYTCFTNHTNNINRIDNRIIKRIFDIVFSSVVCIFLLPLIPIIWILIKVQSPGPLFFKQARTGLNGETFMVYKFRSMHVNKDADRVQATKEDPRKFAFGEFMRKTNIDELPQFFNVLKGDMSIVGPRPHMLYHTETYSEVISKYMVRHFSKPGITGWAQVTGFRGETKELWQMEERIKRDIWYNENWSFGLDLKIIFRTILQVIHPDEHAY